MRMMYDYAVSFEASGRKQRAQKSGLNIHEIIKKVRREYPDAKMFRILNKKTCR